MYTLNRTHTMSNFFSTKKQLLQEVKAKLLPFLSFYEEKQKVSLIFDPNQGVNYYNIYIKLRGFVMCNVQISIKSECQILIEVPLLEQSLIVNINQDAYELFNHKMNLTRIIKANLLYYKLKKTLSWSSCEKIFENIDNASSLFNNDYVKSLMDMEEHFSQLYTFDIEKFKTRVSCFTYKEQVILKATFDRETIEINLKSKNYNFLQDMQCFSITKSFKTLSTSLELESVLLKCFPRISQLSKV